MNEIKFDNNLSTEMVFTFKITKLTNQMQDGIEFRVSSMVQWSAFLYVLTAFCNCMGTILILGIFTVDLVISITPHEDLIVNIIF